MARAQRAQAAWDEFLAPILDGLDAEYVKRLREVSTSEFSYKARSDKQTALSTALVVTQAIRSGLQEVIRDGELANAERLRAEKVEKMTAPQRRLLGIAPY